MTDHHQTSEWRSIQKRLTPIYQQQVDSGTAICGRCGRRVMPGQRFQIGHVTDVAICKASGWPAADINADSNLRLEHASCNESAGGRLSQAMAGAKVSGIDARHWQW
jgi:hypothetical protein